MMTMMTNYDDTHIKVNALLTVSVTPWTVLLPWKIMIVIAMDEVCGAGGGGGEFNLGNCIKLILN